MTAGPIILLQLASVASGMRTLSSLHWRVYGSGIVQRAGTCPCSGSQTRASGPGDIKQDHATFLLVRQWAIYWSIVLCCDTVPVLHDLTANEQYVTLHTTPELGIPTVPLSPPTAYPQAASRTPQDAAWSSVSEPPKGLGLALQGYTWRQNQSHVEVFARLPQRLNTRKVGCGCWALTLSLPAYPVCLMPGWVMHTVHSHLTMACCQRYTVEVLRRHKAGHPVQQEATDGRELLRDTEAHDVHMGMTCCDTMLLHAMPEHGLM